MRARLSIRYIYRENGGKQRAHNTALEHCNEELFFTVDSDDYLVDTAIEQVIDTWNEWRDRPNIAGIIALCGNELDRAAQRPSSSQSHSDENIRSLRQVPLCKRRGINL